MLGYDDMIISYATFSLLFYLSLLDLGISANI